jgi:hypothetical protein
MTRASQIGYQLLMSLTVVSVGALPGGVIAAIWTGEWRWLIASGLAALFLGRLVAR